MLKVTGSIFIYLRYDTLTLMHSKDKSLQEALVSATIGGSKGERDPSEIADVFDRYLKKSVSGIDIHSTKPVISTASLNSICAFVNFSLDGQTFDTLAKVHIESKEDNKSISSAAGVAEYNNAQLLSDFNFPIVHGIDAIPFNPDYPVLFYERIESPTLFDLLEDSYKDPNNPKIQAGDLDCLATLERKTGKIASETMKIVEASALNSECEAPVQTLFNERMKSGGRIDQWYTPETILNLPGHGEIAWSELLNKQWVVNGVRCSNTISDFIDTARTSLAFQDVKNAAICISHGDDHAGNVFILREKNRAVVFDPAFSGWNPAVLGNIKPLVHSGLLPMAGMYYPPNGGQCNFQLTADKIIVEFDFEKTPMFEIHQKIFNIIFEERILPIFKRMEELGIDINPEIERLRLGMASCCLDVIHLGGLLENYSLLQQGHPIVTGTGEGLLPMMLLILENKGLPQLETMERQLAKILLK